MLLPDVNVLIYAHRQDAPDHADYRQRLEEVINDDAAFGLADLVLSGFMRVVMHPRMFNPALVDRRSDRVCKRTSRAAQFRQYWPRPTALGLFVSMCRRAGARGNLVPDAYLAALAIESGSAWITTDRGSARYPGLHWRHPLDS